MKPKHSGTAAMAALLLGLSAASAPAQTAGSAFRDCPDCPEMVTVPAGTFLMGRKADPFSNAQQPPANEQPQHQVTLKSFAIGKHEVTQEQWFALMGDNPSYNKGRTLPVENVSWEDIQTFIGKLNAKTGKRYRLPTEAEWEYAARAGSTTLFSFGEIRRSWAATAGTPPTRSTRPTRSARSCRTSSACTTPPAMSGSGCRTATPIITPVRAPMAQPLRGRTAATAWCGAAPGKAARIFSARPSAAACARCTGFSISASGWPCRRSSALNFDRVTAPCAHPP